MKLTQFERAIAAIDKKNSEDFHIDYFQGQEFPKELLYSHRMTKKLLAFNPNTSEELQIAARAQHICRWKISRNEYPNDKKGYLKWREALKIMHADIVSDILKDVSYDSEFINRVTFLIQKKQIKKDKEAQTMEDVVCLVFLEYYFEEFATKHDDKKLIGILRKTWLKMSVRGQEAAIKLDFSARSQSLISQAIEQD